MDALKALLSAASVNRPSDQVQQLLACLQDSSFNLDVHLCSVGGVGSTELSNLLNINGLTTNTLTDQDSWRHCNRPVQYGASAPRRVVYLFGDPLAAVASHFRRGQALHQAIKTSGNSRLSAADFPATFEEYVIRGEDLFGLEAHMTNWMAGPSPLEVLCVRYEALFDPQVSSALLHYLCAHKKSAGEVAGMAERLCQSHRPRSSQVPPEAYGHMYQALWARVDASPPIFIKSPTGECLGVPVA